jgi:tetratricopeptide (TPR) repeat protein
MSTLPEGQGPGGPQKAVNIGQQMVYGGVNINLGSAPAAQPPLQGPIRKLPPRQYDTFAGRERELRDLHACFAHGSVVGVTQQAAVHSHGGVGKTSLAIEYGWRHLDDYPGGVFFLSCERAPVPPLAELAPYLRISATENAEETAALVKERLEASAPSLLILDNVEGREQWLAGRWNSLLPQSPCRRLVTTQATLLPAVRMIALERLSAEDGLQLLANFRDDAREDQRSAAMIVEWFDGLAVGLTVVGVYMQMHPLLSWKAYADDLHGRGLETVRETEVEIGEAMEYEGRAGSVFDDVLRALPAAERRAIEYAALLPEDNVYAPWLVELLDGDGVEMRPRPGYTDAPAQQVVDALVSRQLLRPRAEDRRVLGLHRVLRRRVAERFSGDERGSLLERIGELAERRGEASRNAVTEVEVRAELTLLAALAQALDEVGRTAAGVSLTNWIAESLRQMGRYPEARALVERFVDSSRQDTAGPEEAATLLHNFAIILQAQGEFPEARRRIKQALAIIERHFPPDGTRLAIIYSNAAMIYYDEGELVEARHRMEQAIAIKERNLPSDDPALAASYSNLSTILEGQGNFPEARRRIEQAITIEEQHFPSDHPRLATSYSNLAIMLKHEGELAEARLRMEQAIVIEERHFPPDHPKLAIRYSNLATILTDQGELRGARSRIEQAIAIEERHFAPDHPTLAVSYNNLGDILLASGDTDGACALYRRADNILRKHFSPEHPHRQIASRKLAMCREEER